ncbi:MAG: M24 family metallopeptidase [Actinobacteria bacterium]|nr:M24 family metallopeptidase [Actinomycetota bacterium]
MVEEAPRLITGAALSDLYTVVDPVRMRRERAEKARAALKRHGVAAVVATGAQTVRYLTGAFSFDIQPMTIYTLFFAEGDPVVFPPAGSYHQLPDMMPWITEWQIARSWFEGVAGVEASNYEAAKFADAIAGLLKERGLANERLGVMGFDPLAVDALKEAGLEVVDGTPLILEASQTKTSDEITCLQLSASISGVGFQRGREVLKPGMTHAAVAREMATAIGGAGAEQINARAVAGPLAFERGLFGVPRIIEHGDIGYLWTCGTSYMGYTACLYRSFVLGRQPSAKEKSWYSDLHDRVDAVIDAIRPGATTADAAQHFPPASKWGYADEAEVLTVEFGHGVGLVNVASRHPSYNWPVINRQWSFDFPQVFEPGMVIAIESLEGEHRVGGVRLESMVVVTEDGAKLLDAFPRDEMLVIN